MTLEQAIAYVNSQADHGAIRAKWADDSAHVVRVMACDPTARGEVIWWDVWELPSGEIYGEW